MADHGTFSAVVAEALRRSNRPDRVLDIVSYTRTSIRECAIQAFFNQDFKELSYTVVATPCVWTIPQYFRQLAFAKYPYWDVDGRAIFAKEKIPSNVITLDRYWYYRAGNDYVFSNTEIGIILAFGYYEYPKALAYFALEVDRPATFNLDTGLWSYHANYTATAVLQATARDLVTNWLLTKWHDTLVEGALAKLWKTAGDQRAAATYGLYKSLQKDILAGEANSTVGV